MVAPRRRNNQRGRADKTLPFEYPSMPPEWLPSWPSRAEISAMFPSGMRSYSHRAMSKGPPSRIQWTRNSLTADIGHQRAAWRLINGTWQRRCSCGYPDAKCAHVYALAQIFDQILQQENWLHAGGRDDVPSKTAPPTSPGRTSRPSGNRYAQLELFGHVPPESQGACRLEVEVDFHHEPGMATLRFYQFHSKRRQLLRLQQLYNLGMRARQGGAAADAWAQDDRRFLAWLTGRLRGKTSLRQNIQVLKLSREQFAEWQDTWAECPGRFIERATQQAITRGAQAARMHVELEDQGEWIGIALIVTGPSGQRCHFHEIFDMLASGQREVVVDGQMLELNPPLPWDLLCDAFSKRTPRMRREHICEYLPPLLNNRLDLLRGALVERREEERTCHVETRADGADVMVRPTVGDALLHPDTLTAAGALRQTAGRFVVSHYTSQDLPALRHFLSALPLEEAGEGWLRLPGQQEQIEAFVREWKRLPGSIQHRLAPELEPLLSDTVGITPSVTAREDGKFVDVQVVWSVGDRHVGADEVRDALRQERAVLRTRDGAWLHVEPEAFKRLQVQVEALGADAFTPTRLFRPDAKRRIQGLRADLGCLSARTTESFVHRLVVEGDPPRCTLPEHLDPVLRPYQKEGFEFLADRSAYHIGAVLADDMGLGKTVQVLSLLDAYFRQNQPRGGKRRGALVICPASVVYVWVSEAAKFCPGLRCHSYSGQPGERELILQGADWDVLVANYAIVRADAAAFQRYDYEFVVLDEAQQIKNPDAQITTVVKQLRTPRPLALTGTPLENRMLDLWSILDFLNPGYLEDADSFRMQFADGDPSARARLRERMAPLMLRRTKEHVASDLPPRTEEVLKVDLSAEQQLIYDRELVRARAVVAERGPIEILAALTRLRQVCCDPKLVEAYRDVTAPAAKLELLSEMLEQLIGEGHSALIFSQFTSMLKLVREHLAAAGISPHMLTGSTPGPRRAELVEKFNNSDQPEVFLLSLKAAGTGLTLTKADYVFLFDPWWNPAVERQAIDRTHRIGQTKPVIAYRLVAAGTVEEKVLALQREKAELFNDIVEGAAVGSVAQRLTAADLAGLIS